MQKNLVKFMQSVVVLPVFATTLITAPMSGIMSSPTAVAIFPDTNTPLSSELAVNQQMTERLEKAAKIDAYFNKYNLPMAGYGLKLVTAAEENDLPPYILASIAFNESTACKFIIKGTNNCFGWGGGKIRFKSMDEAIDTVALAISGNGGGAAHHYEGKTIEQILIKYNGAGVNHKYVPNVLMVMNRIENMKVQQPIAAQSDNKQV